MSLNIAPGTSEPVAHSVNGEAHHADRLTFNERDLRTFLDHILDPSAGKTEMRVFNAKYATGSSIVPDLGDNPRTLSAWYDNAEALIADAKKLNGVSAYLCLNPANPALFDFKDWQGNPKNWPLNRLEQFGKAT